MANKARGASQKNNVKLQAFLLSVLLLAILSTGLGFTVREISKYHDQAIECFRVGQEKLLAQVSRNVTEGLYQSEERAIEALKAADTSGSRHWFLYGPDGVIFERNTAVTLEVAGFSIKQLADRWKIQGGENIDDFTDLMYEKRNGSLSFAKHADEGMGLTSVARIDIEDKTYFVGVFTLESYILTSSGVHVRTQYLQVFAGASGTAVAVFGLLLVLRLLKCDKEAKAFELDVQERTRQIDELSERLKSRVDAVEDVSIYDVLTGVYNKVFFDNLLSRIRYEIVKPVSLMVVDINGIDRLNETEGYATGDELLKRTAALLEKFCIESDLIARTDNSEFSVLMTNADEEQAYDTMGNILRQYASIDNRGLTLSIGVAEMPDGDERIFPTVRLAKKNMMLNKMLDPTSSSYSTITMLMEILVSFSKESVAQSNRMRDMALDFGKELGFSPSEVACLALAAQLHDVGKIGIPINILHKQTPLSPQERELIKWHPEIGYNILKSLPYLDDIALDVLQHRERYDGSGYPQGLTNGQIRPNARILNLLESYDAMTHDRVYAAKLTPQEALNELASQASQQYDPYLLERFMVFISEKLNRRRNVS